MRWGKGAAVVCHEETNGLHLESHWLQISTTSRFLFHACPVSVNSMSKKRDHCKKTIYRFMFSRPSISALFAGYGTFSAESVHEGNITLS